MVEDRITDGHRIAQLLASEVTGREGGPLAAMAVVDADPDVEPSESGAFAYGIDRGDERLADAAVHPDRVTLELRVDPATGVETAADAGLEARPAESGKPRTLVVVDSGAAVKSAVDVLVAVAGG